MKNPLRHDDFQAWVLWSMTDITHILSYVIFCFLSSIVQQKDYHWAYVPLFRSFPSENHRK